MHKTPFAGLTAPDEGDPPEPARVPEPSPGPEKSDEADRNQG